jgi:hypothetical protein
MYKILKTNVCNAQTNDIYPQIEHMGPDYDWRGPTSIRQIVANSPLQFVPNMRSFHLDPATKRTDLISQGLIYRMGLLASAQFASSLAGFVVQRYQAIPAEVVFHGDTFNYVWIHFTREVEEQLDFSATRFALREQNGTESAIDIATPRRLAEVTSKLAGSGARLVVRKIFFHAGTPEYDLFCLALGAFEYFVSDRLASDLVRRRLTGFDVEKSDISVVWELAS